MSAFRKGMGGLLVLGMLAPAQVWSQSLAERIDEIVYLYYDAYGRQSNAALVDSGRKAVEAMLVDGWSIDQVETLVWRVLNEEPAAGRENFEQLVPRLSTEWGKPVAGGWDAGTRADGTTSAVLPVGDDPEPPPPPEAPAEDDGQQPDGDPAPTASLDSVPVVQRITHFGPYAIRDLRTADGILSHLPATPYDGLTKDFPKKLQKLLDREDAGSMVKAAEMLVDWHDDQAFEQLSRIHAALWALGDNDALVQLAKAIEGRPSHLRLRLLVRDLLGAQDEDLVRVCRIILSKEGDAQMLPVALYLVLSEDRGIKKMGARMVRDWVDPVHMAVYEDLLSWNDPVVRPYVMGARERAAEAN